MEAEFLGQPFFHRSRLGWILDQALTDAESFQVVTAWAQVSGMRHIAKAIRELRSRGGTASAILGIDGGIATQDALSLAIDLFDVARIFHDSGARLFHPKIYCVQRPTETVVAIGSSNLTGGGLFLNYEANLVLRLDPDEPEDVRLHRAVQGFLDNLTQADGPCKRLTPELVDLLAEEEALVTSSERHQEAERTARAKAESWARGLFGPPVEGLPGVPHEPRTNRQTDAQRQHQN